MILGGENMPYSVIFVDDEPWTVSDMQHSINWKDEGYEIIGVYDKPEIALEAIITKKPDLVFTDIQMPVMDGFELISKCQEKEIDTQFVILSGYSEFHYAKQAIQASAIDYCLKPINPEVLTKLLGTIKKKFEKMGKKSYDDKKDHFEQILDYLEEHYNEKITLKEISENFSFHRNYICHLFRKNLDDTFSGYLTKLRVESSKKLLTESNMEISDIANEVGLDYYYFSKLFKKFTGFTPDAYRKAKLKEIAR